MKINNRQPSGLASIVIVLMLTVVISLLTLGFSQLMNRAIQQSTGNDLSAAADYAARVGINEAASYLKAFNNPATHCTDLISPGQPLARAGGLSGDENVKYTCVLINTKPADVFYQLLSAYKSQVTKLFPSSDMDQMMISWESSESDKHDFPGPQDRYKNYTESSWSDSHFPPVIRLTLYPSPGSGNAKDNWVQLKAMTRTIFLYPYADNGPHPDSNTPVTRIDWGSLQNAKDGQQIPVHCGADIVSAQNGVAAFNGKITMDCNAIFVNMPKQGANPAPYTIYARITPLYTNNTNVRLLGQDLSGNPVTFDGTQSIVDVTAKAGNAAKRLQARIDAIPAESVDPQLRPAEDAAPEYAVRSAGTICKVFIVPTSPKNTDVSLPPVLTRGDYNGACPVDYTVAP